jgi:hypothetical protein
MGGRKEAWGQPSSTRWGTYACQLRILIRRVALLLCVSEARGCCPQETHAGF